MRKLFAAAVAFVFTIGFASASLAGPGEHGSVIGDSSLVIQVKSHHKCEWKRVCDYFAPATSCSHPPCCKKSHHEKVCEETQSGQDNKANKADIAATQCFRECDAKRNACDNFGRSGNEEVATLCRNERTACQKQCDDARAKN